MAGAVDPDIPGALLAAPRQPGRRPDGSGRFHPFGDDDIDFEAAHKALAAVLFVLIETMAEAKLLEPAAFAKLLARDRDRLANAGQATAAAVVETLRLQVLDLDPRLKSPLAAPHHLPRDPG